MDKFIVLSFFDLNYMLCQIVRMVYGYFNKILLKELSFFPVLCYIDNGQHNLSFNLGLIL